MTTINSLWSNIQIYTLLRIWIDVYLQLSALVAVHCRAWSCMFLVRLRETNFDCWCIIASSFLHCSIHYSWVFRYTTRTQVRLELDKEQEFKVVPSFLYGLYHCWDYCRLDLSIDGLGKHVSGCWILVLFHVLLGIPDFVLGTAQRSFRSSLFVMLWMGINFMESLPSN